jgi:hypothetical protein
MTRIFAVEKPEDLRAMEHLVKSGAVTNRAAAWSAIRRKYGCSQWDGKIFVEFSTEGRERHARAYVVVSPRGEKKVFAELKYTPALDFAKKNLHTTDAAI